MNANGDWNEARKKALADFFIHKTSNIAWIADEYLHLVFAKRQFYHYFSLGIRGAGQHIAVKASKEMVEAFDRHDLQLVYSGDYVDRQTLLFNLVLCPIKISKDRLNDPPGTVIRMLEKERALIGYELRDNVNQLLRLVTLTVRMLHPDTEEEKMIRDRSIEQLDSAIEAIRMLSRQLTVPSLHGGGLLASIQDLIGRIRISNAINIEFHHDRPVYPISTGKKVALFRIAQTQLKNILDHSKATVVRISLNLVGKEVQLMLQDNGIGFDLRKEARGIGFSPIYERARAFNGAVHVETAEGRGCKVIIRMPVDI